ncbi:hypothetical protein ABW21_db0208717 [Orbilia brochopaga]|nr:hypothetical protein ABW21_db0208717 [Drechslerella brochopaga]
MRLAVAASLFSALAVAHPVFENSFHPPSVRLRDLNTTIPGTGSNGGQWSIRISDPSQAGLDPGVKQYSGYFDDNANDKHIFFWFFESRSTPKQDPVMLWLAGGPGCSGFLDSLSSGPSILEKGQIRRNPFSLNSNASVLYIDQPINTGLSHSSKIVNSTVDAGKDVYGALTAFFKKFPEYSTQDFHMAGPSYAGRYLPVFAHEILQRKPQERNINLKSIMIGNGMVNQFVQSQSVYPMSCGKGGFPSFLTPEQCQPKANETSLCKSAYDACWKFQDPAHCKFSKEALNACYTPMQLYSETNRSAYDVRKFCNETGSGCEPGFPEVDAFVNRKDFLTTIGADNRGNQTFETCNNSMFSEFSKTGDGFMPYHNFLPDALKEIQVLVYNGDADMLCNWLGSQAWAEELEWSGKSSYNQKQMQPFRLTNGTEAGQTKSAEGLTFLRVFGASHGAAGDVPEVALKFYNRWFAAVHSGKKTDSLL